MTAPAPARSNLDYRRWARGVKVKPHLKSTLNALVAHAWTSSFVYPSQRVLAEITGKCVRQIQRDLKALAALRVIVIMASHTMDRTRHETDTYVLQVPWLREEMGTRSLSLVRTDDVAAVRSADDMEDRTIRSADDVGDGTLLTPVSPKEALEETTQRAGARTPASGRTPARKTGRSRPAGGTVNPAPTTGGVASTPTRAPSQLAAWRSDLDNRPEPGRAPLRTWAREAIAAQLAGVSVALPAADGAG